MRASGCLRGSADAWWPGERDGILSGGCTGIVPESHWDGLDNAGQYGMQSGQSQIGWSLQDGKKHGGTGCVEL